MNRPLNLAVLSALFKMSGIMCASCDFKKLITYKWLILLVIAGKALMNKGLKGKTTTQSFHANAVLALTALLERARITRIVDLALGIPAVVEDYS